jgi:septum formation protein
MQKLKWEAIQVMSRAATPTADVTGIVLASGSAIRRQLLENAGIVCRVAPAVIDEAAIRAGLASDNPHIEPASIADVLARAKAEMISRKFPNALVIGADQVLSLPSVETAKTGVMHYDLMHKAESMDLARATLLRLRGVTHHLHVGVAIAERGEVTWSATDHASLKMRKFSTAFLDQYMARAGGALFDSVGAYQLEGLGLQLFEQIEGNYFTILGLPMLPLLEELRKRGVGGL